VTSGADPPGTHHQGADNPWTINIVDHPNRTESRWFRESKVAVKKILATLGDKTYPYGPGPWQMHHGGSIWVLTDAGWRMYLARAGIEWSMQFCADPAKIDRLRTEAPKANLDLKRVVAIGHSAGGHLALWLAGRPRIPLDSPLASAADQPPLRLAGAISLAGVADLLLAWRLNLGDNATCEFLAGSPTHVP